MTNYIDNSTMQNAAQHVAHFLEEYPEATIHTVTVTLRGRLGGVEVTIEADGPEEKDIFNDQEIQEQFII